MKAKIVFRVSIALAVAFLMVFSMYACDSSSGGCGQSGSLDYGPYDTDQDMNSGAGGRSGVFYPSNIASGSETFPVLVFGCGAGSGPSQYEDHGNVIASHGFIVIITASDNAGNMNTNAIDWIVDQNSTLRSKFYGKVNTQKLAAGGHSMGSIGTFNMPARYHQRLTTTVHVAGGSFTGTGPSNLKNPTIYISGTGDMALANCRTDYQRTTVPVFFTIQQGVDHIAAAREGLPAICAWLKWHLRGETQLRNEFLVRGGEFTIGKWDSQWKNW